MKFGLSVPVQHPPGEPGAERLRELLEQVKLARDLGFDSISASQHYLPAPFQYFQPIPLLARIAAESGEMMLITNILLLPLYNPVDLAEQLATLDIIYDGRLVCGVGLGYGDVEYTFFGVERASRVSRMVVPIEMGQSQFYQGVGTGLRPGPEPFREIIVLFVEPDGFFQIVEFQVNRTNTVRGAGDPPLVPSGRRILSQLVVGPEGLIILPLCQVRVTQREQPEPQQKP